MKRIELTQGKFAIVDDADFWWLDLYNWYAKQPSEYSPYYAARFQRINGKPTTIYMHRDITGCPAGMEVDHRNRKTLDNRRGNLKIVSKTKNLQNRIYGRS